MADAGSSYLNTPTRTEEQARADVVERQIAHVRARRISLKTAVAKLCCCGWDEDDAIDALLAALREGSEG